jgi:hypothetical protein
MAENLSTASDIYCLEVLGGLTPWSRQPLSRPVRDCFTFTFLLHIYVTRNVVGVFCTPVCFAEEP